MRTAFPEINTTIAHLRDVLGDQTYESLACEGAPAFLPGSFIPTRR